MLGLLKKSRKLSAYRQMLDRPTRQITSTLLKEAILSQKVVAVGFGYFGEANPQPRVLSDEQQSQREELNEKIVAENSGIHSVRNQLADSAAYPRGPEGTEGMPIWYEFAGTQFHCRDCIAPAIWPFVFAAIAETVVAAVPGGPRCYLEYDRSDEAVKLVKVELLFDSNNLFWIRLGELCQVNLRENRELR